MVNKKTGLHGMDTHTHAIVNASMGILTRTRIANRP